MSHQSSLLPEEQPPRPGKMKRRRRPRPYFVMVQHHQSPPYRWARYETSDIAEEVAKTMNRKYPFYKCWVENEHQK